MVIQIEAAKRLIEAKLGREELTMITNLGNLRKFGPKRAEEIFRKGPGRVEVSDEVGHHIADEMKKLRYKTTKHGSTTYVWLPSGEGGLEIEFGAGEDAYLKFFEED